MKKNISVGEREYIKYKRYSKYSIKNCRKISKMKYIQIALTGVVQCVEHHPINQKDPGLIPSQRT